MAYLAKDDYTISISVENLDEIIAQGIISTSLTADQFRNKAENWAMAYVKSFLGAQYNIIAEYALDSASADRDPVILQITIDLALCRMHKTINPRDVPEHIAIGCEGAQKWLEDARDGTVGVGIPVLPGETPLQSTFLDSQIKFISKPYQDESLFDPTITP
jgi:hypothetical protein